MNNYIKDKVEEIKACVSANNGVLDSDEISQILNTIYDDGYSDAYENK